MLRPLRIIFEVIAGLVAVIIIFGLLLIWRLSAGPIHSSFATPYLEAIIEGLVPDTDTQITNTLLTWDENNRSVALHADGIRIVQKNGAVIAEVPALDIQLSAIGIVFGRFLPTELMIDHPQLKLERRADGVFTFGGMAAKGDDGDKGNIRKSLVPLARHLAHAYFTHKLEISKAVFDIHDTATNSNWSVHIPEISLQHVEGALTGKVALDVTQKNKASTLDIHYLYDHKKSVHRLVTKIAGITPAFFAGGHPATLGLAPASLFNLPLTGEIAVAFDDDLDVAAANVQLHGDAGFLNDPDFWDKPRAVKSLDIKADFDRKAGHLNIPSVVIDFGGPRVNLSATGKTGIFALSKMDITLDAQIDNWPIDQYSELWPKPIIANPRDWIIANLSKGKFDHGEASFQGTLAMDDPSDIVFTEGKGKITASNGSVKYLEGMPPVEGISAEANFDLDHMTVQISSGGIGDIRLTPFTLTINAFQDNVQNIEIPLQIAGSIPSILRLLDQPRLGYAKAVGLSPDDIGGRATGMVYFRMPLLKDLDMKDIDIKATANLSGVETSKLVKGVDVTQGNLALALSPKAFELKGPATLNKIPVQIVWKQNFQEVKGEPFRQATLTGGITADQLQAAGIDLFNGTKGPISVELDIIQPSKDILEAAAVVDMTAADVRIDQLNWKKPPNIPATVKLSAERTGETGNIIIKSVEAHGPQLNIKGSATFSGKTDEILALELDPLVVGRTNAALKFSQAETADGALRFDAKGKAFDVSGLKGGKDPERANPRPKEYHIEVDRLYTSENGFINNAKGFAIRDTKGWSEISLHGMADGGHELALELTPNKDGTRSFSLTCDDFGKGLKGMGFTDTVRDGNVDIRGESDPDSPRVILGDVVIGHFTVSHLPVLAVLMNAASPFGFAGLFSDSMEFDNLKGKFRWENDDIKLIGVHAAGASVGINANGHVDMASTEAKLDGTMVPFSVMNSMLNAIPVLGDLITGGKGEGVFAVSYSINGPLGDPHIGVNPVSLLTPGILRTLFFGSSDDDEDEKPEKP